MKKLLFFMGLLSLSTVIYGQKRLSEKIKEYPVPENIEQSIEILDKITPEDDKQFLREMSEEEFWAKAQHMIGRVPLDRWFPPGGSSLLTRYFEKKGISFFSYMENIIYIAFHRHLNNRDINLQQIVDRFIESEKRWELKNNKKAEENNRLLSLIKSSFNLFTGKQTKFLKKHMQDHSLYFLTDNYPPGYFFEDTVLDLPIQYLSSLQFEKIDKKSFFTLSLDEIMLKGTQLVIEFSINEQIRMEYDTRMHDVRVISRTYFYEYSDEEMDWTLIKTELTY